MKYYLWTIGCQMNMADSRRAAEELEKLGFYKARQPEAADLVVLNTCVVRQSAEDKVLGRLTSLAGLKRRRPEMTLALMGCFVHEIPSLQHHYPWVDAFILPSDVQALVDLARQKADGRTPESRQPDPGRVPVSVGVPISFGCDHLCTYCIVRLRRGRESSRPVDEIVAEVRDLAARGVREVTLLGQNVDSYGHDLDDGGLGRPPDLADLLEAVHAVSGLARIRFLTSHPADMAQRLVETAARLPLVCEHMELPVQAGDDAVLRRMGRGYTVAEYRDLVARIRAAMPGVGLATDVIVGFPGETAGQFEATYRLLEEIRFDMVHVAAYSPRPGTPSARLADDVPAREKDRRRKAVDDLQERIVAEINAGLVGQTVEVLVEERHRGKWRGRTRTNKLVFFDVGQQDRAGQLVPVRITQAGAWSMQAEPVDGEGGAA
ncbi:MAG: tRNA (N6-isopentenyl adenosine(37)-C2)-methylthiotransferase MiaB [Anaerolineae bacterium]|jgi:tRNA-2-methylthio-N6-dimethylallyladenosine synthase|nr:tRNA (N6-isopentenyl adenosine(37)-C2)-methylthiotransferase MiaB [Anaerolineae bacterium]